MIARVQAGGREYRLYVETVRRIERALAARGFDPGETDGRFDAELRAALEAFQRAERLPATGAPDQATLARLLYASAPVTRAEDAPGLATD